MKQKSMGAMTFLLMTCSLMTFNCVSTQKEHECIHTPERVTLSSSTDPKYWKSSVPFGIYPSYVQDPEQFRRFNLGIGTFQGRHLLEDEVRKSAQRNIGTMNAYRRN